MKTKEGKKKEKREGTDLVSIVGFKKYIKIISQERLDYIRLIAPHLEIFKSESLHPLLKDYVKKQREYRKQKQGYDLFPVEYRFVYPIEHLVDFVDVFVDNTGSYPKIYGLDIIFKKYE